MKHEYGSLPHNTQWLCLTALMMAINVILSSFSIPVPGGHFYFNEIIITIAAISLDPAGAFVVAGIGAFLGDFFFYPAPMFVSLVVHGIQGVVISVIARKCLTDKPIVASVMGVTAGQIISCIGYFLGRSFVYSTMEYAMIKIPFDLLEGVIDCVIGLFICWKWSFPSIVQRIIIKK
ncbi:ECF transporter S component [Dialister micraerophilus]|uniref:Integral membrane protein n=1 Tax=Dialister micraerophilus DSM 19965 TaxID=888062 RepID=F2BWV9_9FIRM|nr:ECF transporter S component [Dialister micraerophilus]EGF14226.1 hypothetical protein HMPREF9083_0677 [Dialister micraerophilus DSM 19965]